MGKIPIIGKSHYFGWPPEAPLPGEVLRAFPPLEGGPVGEPGLAGPGEPEDPPAVELKGVRECCIAKTMTLSRQESNEIEARPRRYTSVKYNHKTGPTNSTF